MGEDRLTRRAFIKGSIALGVAVLGFGGSRLDGLLEFIGAGEAKSRRWGMLIDLSKCIGCHRCTAACRKENGLPPGIEWNHVYRVGKKDAREYWLPRLCMHCANPPCLSVCPTGATSKREDGIVMIDELKCIGCEYCIWACPYDARYFNPVDGFVSKCTFCFRRVDEGRKPACVEACPVHARIFGDLLDPRSEVCEAMKAAGDRVFVLHPEFGTDPSVRYIKP